VEEASVLGLHDRVLAANAALANGMLFHALDFDDTHSDSVAHVSAVVVPAALAVAEAKHRSGRELLEAIVAANEIVTRIGMAASSEFHARGFHPTAVAGVFGAAAACARLRRCDGSEAASALGIAGSFASGLFAYLDEGTPTKPIHAGWAAHGGVLASELAEAGSQGPRGILENRFGLYDAFIGRIPKLEPQLADLGSRWETRRIAYKAYPACHYMHGALGAAAELAVDPDEIEEIVATVPEAAVALVLEPVPAKVAPRSEYDAKFSLQFSIASLLLRGGITVKTYTRDGIADEEVLELARRVRYEVREFATYPAAFPGGVRIRLRDGTLREAELSHQKGGPENPLAGAAVVEKFRQNAGLALARDEVTALEGAVTRLERADSVAAVASPLRSAAPAEARWTS
jgi:2-methylcitrate dehydratase PrpD